MKTDTLPGKKLKKLFSSQKFGVLATQDDNNPYTSLIAFAVSEDMRQIIFATPKNTRKFANISSNSSVSFFIDNRSNKTSDFKEAIGVTVVGSVRALRKNKGSKSMKLYLEKHPQLASFLDDKSCAFLCIDICSLFIVESFQNVTEVHFDDYLEIQQQ